MPFFAVAARGGLVGVYDRDHRGADGRERRLSRGASTRFLILTCARAANSGFFSSAGGNAYAVFLVLFSRGSRVWLTVSFCPPGQTDRTVDFPGALTLFLAIPTVWAVLKALKRIQEGRRPTPNERADQTFWELAREKEQRRRLRMRMRRRRRGEEVREWERGGEWS